MNNIITVTIDYLSCIDLGNSQLAKDWQITCTRKVPSQDVFGGSSFSSDILIFTPFAHYLWFEALKLLGSQLSASSDSSH